jgi:glycine/D-amino acid oxidase-like deaminating enzyme
VSVVRPSRSIEQACYWLARRPEREARSLEGGRVADIAVVGAGLAGLWTALWIKELDPISEVVVVEQGVAAYGASGRSAGIVWDSIDFDHALAVAHFGEVEANRLARLGEANLAELAAFLADRKIDCDYEPTGRLLVAQTPHQMDRCRVIVEAAEHVGIATAQLLDKDALRAEVHSPTYVGGVSVTAGGLLDPVKLVDGLRREVERQGVTVFERSHVVAIEPVGARVRVRTGRGRVEARTAVLATSAYANQLLPRLSARIIPMFAYALVSEPLTPAQREVIGWRGRQGVSDARTFGNFYRLTPDNRVLWGSSDVAYHPGSLVDAAGDHSQPHYDALQASFRRHFPALAGLEWAYSWGGPIAVTTRLTPFFGRAREGRIVYGLGFSGRGLASSRLAGRVMALLALERPSELLDLAMVRRPPPRFPPEPFRTLTVRAVLRALRRVDAGAEPGLLLRLLDRLGLGFSF